MHSGEGFEEILEISGILLDQRETRAEVGFALCIDAPVFFVNSSTH
jgi:hypothetical protein